MGAGEIYPLRRTPRVGWGERRLRRASQRSRRGARSVCGTGSRRYKEAEERVWLGHEVLRAAVSSRSVRYFEAPLQRGRGGACTQGVSGSDDGARLFLWAWKESHLQF